MKKIISEEIVTNDIAEIVGEGSFLIKGRVDNVINSGGLKIHPEEIEKKIRSLIKTPFIITSVRDEQLGEKVVLLIEDKSGNIGGLFELWENIEPVLSGAELPKQIEYLASFEWTPNGKIMRRETTQKMLRSCIQ